METIIINPYYEARKPEKKIEKWITIERGIPIKYLYRWRSMDGRIYKAMRTESRGNRELLAENALQYAIKYFGIAHPITGQSYITRAIAIPHGGSVTAKVRLFKKAVKLFRKYYGASSFSTTNTLDMIRTHESLIAAIEDNPAHDWFYKK